MKNKDPDYVVKVEQAIAKKYGQETIQNPKAAKVCLSIKRPLQAKRPIRIRGGGNWRSFYK